MLNDTTPVAPQPIASQPWQMVWTLLVMVAILVLCYYVTKFIAKRAQGGTRAKAQGSYMRIIDRLMLAKDKYILLLEVGGRTLLIGVSNQSVTLLSELEELEELEAAEAPPTFMEALKSLRKGGAEKPGLKRKPRNIEEYLQNESFEKVLKKETDRENIDLQSEDFAAQLAQMDEKMQVRSGRLRSKKDE